MGNRGSRRISQLTLPSILLLVCLASIWVNLFLLPGNQASEEDEDAINHRHFQAFKDARYVNPSRKEKLRPPSVPLSACLLIKDDNDLLNEWIAYHYHELDMRYLIVAVDPSSYTTPVPILQNWERVTSALGDPLQSVVWSDEDYMPADFLKRGYHIAPQYLNGDATKSKWHEGHEDEATVKADTLRITNHRFRQVSFVGACLRHVREMNRTWTLHVDTDEYVVINPVLRGELLEQSLVVPYPENASTVLDFLKDTLQKKPRKHHLNTNYPCISMPRLLFGSVETSNIVNEPATRSSEERSRFPLRLETLQWQYHTNYTDKERNAQPKVLVDVSKVPANDEMFRAKPFSIHRPSKKLCRRIDQLDFFATEKFPLTVNHYLGTLERYMSRNDTRRSRRAYDFKASVQDGHDFWIASWVDGFTKRMGYGAALKLLSFT